MNGKGVWQSSSNHPRVRHSQMLSTQIEFRPIGSPLPPIVANIFKDSFRTKSWRKITMTHKNDDAHRQDEPSNSIQSNNDGNDQSISLIKENPHNSLNTTANRKPTNRGRSLNFPYFHWSATKQGLIRSLFLRAELWCSTSDLLRSEAVKIYSERWNN